MNVVGGLNVGGDLEVESQLDSLLTLVCDKLTMALSSSGSRIISSPVSIARVIFMR